MFALVLVAPGNGAAETFFVNSYEDVSDLNPGDGLCVAYLIVIPPFVLPFCTLRAAIQETNSLAGADEIVLTESTYTLTVEGTEEDSAATGDLDIMESVTISGAGRGETVIDGGGLDRIFDIFGTESRVKIRDLSLQNGRVASGFVEQGGGAIRNYATLSLTAVALSNNYVGGGGGGGAICNLGNCTLLNASVSLNGAWSGGALWNAAGAAMRVEQSTVRHSVSGAGGCLLNFGKFSLVNSTVSNNGAADGVAEPVAIWNSGEMELVQVTVAENTKADKGVGLQNFGELTMVNTLIAGHGGQDCRQQGGLTSLGGNLDSDTSCKLDGETDLSGLDPLLGSLGAHGGSTWSHLFLLTSPAMDNGVDLSAGGMLVDQRGRERPRGNGYDIGAVELQFSTILPALLPLLL
ncbi:MAG: choice-of-anchor Q domain-containing protein [Thermodesulfobacteriota bacterium]